MCILSLSWSAFGGWKALKEPPLFRNTPYITTDMISNGQFCKWANKNQKRLTWLDMGYSGIMNGSMGCF